MTPVKQAEIGDPKRIRYQSALDHIPPSGGGGCHSALLRVANYGRLAGVSPDRVANDLAAHVHGTRKVTGNEIAAAVRKAFTSQATIAPYVRVKSARPRPL